MLERVACSVGRQGYGFHPTTYVGRKGNDWARTVRHAGVAPTSNQRPAASFRSPRQTQLPLGCAILQSSNWPFFANMLTFEMNWEIACYSDEVQETIGGWPVGIRAYYARLTKRMCVFGPNLGMPFTRSLGQDLFEIRARGKEGIGRAFFCTAVIARRRLADTQRQRGK
jgi:hypothetical protein